MSNPENFSHLLPQGENFFRALHDGHVHNPLGAASYVYEKEFIKPVMRYLGVIPSSASFPPNDEDELVPEPSTETAVLPSEDDVDSDNDSAIVLREEKSCTTVIIHIGAQPNNSPHVGTIVTFTLAFILAQHLQTEFLKLRARALAQRAKKVRTSSSADAAAADAEDDAAFPWADSLRAIVQLDLVDTAPDNSRTIVRDGITYQRSHRATGAMHEFLGDYHALLAELAAFTHGTVAYRVANQEDTMRTPAMLGALRALVCARERLAVELAPHRETLTLRAACPVEGCGLADKHGVHNTYDVAEAETRVTFMCPEHGPHTLVLEDADDRARVELNTPLRNLARALVSLADTTEDPRNGPLYPAPADPVDAPFADLGVGFPPPSQHRRPLRLAHMRVTGTDYSGMYQEQLFFRQLSLLRPLLAPSARAALDAHGPPLIVYAPLILDWSGAKLSKSLYVREGAYRYLEDPAVALAGVLGYRAMVAEGRDRRVLFRMVEEWVRDPKKLHRNYTVEYIRLTFLAAAGGLPEAEAEAAGNPNRTRQWWTPFAFGVAVAILVCKLWTRW